MADAKDPCYHLRSFSKQQSVAAYLATIQRKSAEWVRNQLNRIVRPVWGRGILSLADLQRRYGSRENAYKLYVNAFFNGQAIEHWSQCHLAISGLGSTRLVKALPGAIHWRTYLEAVLLITQEAKLSDALAVLEELQTLDLNDLYLRGKVLVALGQIYDGLNKWDEALEAYAKSLSLFAQLNKPLDEATVVSNIASAWYSKFNQGTAQVDDLERELAQCQQALSVLEPFLKMQNLFFMTDEYLQAYNRKGMLLNTMGLLYFSLNKLDEAIVCYRQELKICRRLFDNHCHASTYGNLGEVHIRYHDWSKAERELSRALEIFEFLEDSVGQFEAFLNLGYLYDQWEKVDLALCCYQQAIEIFERKLQYITEESYRVSFFASAEEVYANLVLLLYKLGRFAEAFNYVERARSRALLYMLQDYDYDEAVILPNKTEAEPLTLEQVQAALPNNALILELFTTDLEETRLSEAAKQVGIQRFRLPEAKILLFAITCDDLSVYDINLPLKDMRPSVLPTQIDLHFLRERVLRGLYDPLIGPVASLVSQAKQLFMVPHGIFHYVPFHAMIAPDQDTLLRQDGPQISYTPSATILLNSKRKPEVPPPYGCLALGYNGNGKTLLRFAETEAINVADCLKGTYLIGPSVKKHHLFKIARLYHILHFSCHGTFDPLDFSQSYLEIAPNETLSVQDILEAPRFNCDLVTLSACETGVNQIRPGDEVSGFIRAFLPARTSSVILALWRVDEYSTWVLMHYLYAGIQQGLGFAQALKQAQLILKNSTYEDLCAAFVEETYLLTAIADLVDQASDKPFADPKYWAAFIIVGTIS